MVPLSIGDLAQSYYNRSSNARLTAELSRLSSELTTGLSSDLARATSGDVGPIASLERSLARLDAYKTTTTEARLNSRVIQSSLENVANQVRALAPLAVTVQDGSDTTALNAVISTASNNFDSAIGALNTRVSGRSIFGGIETDNNALLDGSQIRAQLAVVAATATDADQYNAAIESYFSVGGGFDTSAYLGSTISRDELRISPDDKINLDVRADDMVLRNALAELAKSAVLESGALSGNPQERSLVVEGSVQNLFNVERDIVELQANVGLAQARIETADQRNDAERLGLEKTRLDLIGVDPFETATRLEATQSQLESLYAVTARLSRLSLANYL